MKILLVAINAYPKNRLSGCINDAEDMRWILKQLDHRAEIQKLYDIRATKLNILNGIRWLSDEENIFFFSGHGSQVADINGDEIDGLDETIVNIDYARTGMIRDDEIREAIGDNRIELIMDCCHSGTNTRMFSTTTKIRAIDKGYSSPVEIGRIRNLNDESISWAACQDSEVATETTINGQQRGVFTFNFCQLLRANPRITRSQLKTQLTKLLEKYDQHPNLVCSAENESLKVFES